MSEKHSSAPPDTAVPLKSFPRLENSSNEGSLQQRAPGAANLPAGPRKVTEGGRVIASVPATISSPFTDLASMTDVPVTVVFEVGTQSISVQQLMALTRGSIVPLRNIFVDTIDVKVSGQAIARAEAINMKQRYGVRISEILVPPGVETK